MDLIESRSLQAKCIVNLMTLVAKDRLSELSSLDLPRKAYEIGCLVGMLEGEILEGRINSYNVLDDLPFKDDIYREFVSGVTVVIQQLLIDKNKQQLATDQARLRAIHDEILQSQRSTDNLLGNVNQLEKALISSRLFEQDSDVLSGFHDRVETMRAMGHIKEQERKVLEVLIEHNTKLIEGTDLSLARLPKMTQTLQSLENEKEQLLALETSSGGNNAATDIPAVASEEAAAAKISNAALH